MIRLLNCFRVASLEIGQSYDWPNGSKFTPRIWLTLTSTSIKYNEPRTVCTFPGMY